MKTTTVAALAAAAGLMALPFASIAESLGKNGWDDADGAAANVGLMMRF